MNKDWIKVENFISKDTAKLLYQYTKFGNERLSFLQSKGVTVASNVYGEFNDPQSEGDLKSPVFAMYGDLIFDTLMVNNLEKIENIIDYHTLFMTMCIVIAYKYITIEENIILEQKIQ